MKTRRSSAFRLLSGLALLLTLLPAETLAAPTAPAQATGPIQASTGSNTYRVYAHREGLVGHTTANGHVIQENDRFVALPCFCVLSSKGGNEFQVKIEYKGRTVVAPVWDVGPWNTNDNYWDPPEQRKWTNIPQGVPQAAAAFYNRYNDGKDGKGRQVRSPAGMDIADGTFWHDLGMTDSDWVTVTFLWLEPSTTTAPAPAVNLPPLPEGYEDIPTLGWNERPPLDPVEPKDPSRWTYVPETRHNIPQPFSEFWYSHGGWRNLGLPISEIFREVRSDGSTRIIQYFERSILELNLPRNEHPLVTSALLGHAVYAPVAAKLPIEPFQENESFRYFPQTNHSLGNGFKAHWERHGGLEAFGYPLTEEFSGTSKDGRRYVAQVFERARFEWWPDKVGTGEEITHGLLVVERLRQAGWVP